MYPTYLLRRVIHYLWECHRHNQELRVRLRNYRGDELHVEFGPPHDIVQVRLFVKAPTGELTKQIEVICLVEQYGDWIPIENFQAEKGSVVAATVDEETRRITMLDMDHQRELAGFSDAWAMRLLEEGWLATAAKLMPLKPQVPTRPRWPEPTTEAPDMETLEAWLWEDGGCEATDSCWVEVDGVCPHGHPSWFLRLGLV